MLLTLDIMKFKNNLCLKNSIEREFCVCPESVGLVVFHVVH